MLHAHKFSGSITTGPSVFVMKQRLSDANVQAVDCAKEMFSSVLTLTIDRRAAISAKYLVQTKQELNRKKERLPAHAS
jgi:hypothetical protein